MNVNHTASIVNRYLADFGYSPDDVSDFINVDPTPINPANQSTGSEKKKSLKLSLPKSVYKAGAVSFNLKSDVRPIFITIHNLKGRRIRFIPVSSTSLGKLTASWDGNDASGAKVGAGTYLVNVTQNGKAISKKIELVQ
jgi:flagellar hook assembly protein FlgD